MKFVSVTEARKRFGHLLSEAAKEPVCIERNGRGVAVVLAPADYEHAKDAIALGRVAERIAARDPKILAPLRKYSKSRRTRHATIAALGLHNYSQLLKALRQAGMETPTVPKTRQEAMIRDLSRIVRG